MSKFNRIHLVVLDSVGIGAAPDANNFVNAGVPDGASDTLGHISKTVGLNVPNMAKIGLGNIPRETPLKTVPAESNPTGYATKLEEVSLGKDTMTGHWEIMEYLEQFSTTNQVTIPIRTDDYLVMVKIEDLILADIDKNLLTIYTVDGIYKTKETLTNFQNRINRRNFIQISRHSVINIDHLESLSDSFSGNMMAKMTRGLKSSVSRKYVKSLMDYLGL